MPITVKALQKTGPAVTLDGTPIPGEGFDHFA